MTCKHGLDPELVDCEQCATENRAKAAYMNARDNAFPAGTTNAGLSKREYFAGLAMQAFIGTETEDSRYTSLAALCKHAVQLADALLDELAK